MKLQYAHVYAIERLHRETFSSKDAGEIQTLLAQLSPKRQLPEEHKIGLALPNVSVWVARVRESWEIVSMATLATSPRSLRFTQTAGIWDVVTLKEHQRKGLAESILRELISSARVGDLLYLELFSRPERTAAHSLYKKLGFTCIATATDTEGRHCYRYYLRP